MTGKADKPVFGKRTQQHTLILASGDKVRHLTIRPWMVAIAVCFIGVFGIGYLGATTYLILRDDLIGATMARQARIQHDYEDRIAALRAQVDRVTSRQLLDQQLVEKKVEQLLEQQAALTSRHGKLGSLLERAENSGLPSNEPTARPALSNALVPEKQANLSGGAKAIESLMGARKPASTTPALAYVPATETMSDHADRVFSKVTLSLKNVEQQQLSRISELTEGAEDKADAIAGIMQRTGIRLDEPQDSAVGGPFVEPETIAGDVFDSSLNELDTALNRLELMRSTATALPFGNPAPGRTITSRFGNRLDPFLGRPALHAGLDFRAETGANIRATGAGTVTVASNSGGYGNMVEIDHGKGITTRYGHMSAILVKVGDRIEPGDVIGRAGSTGRSTGPHIHYEVRRNDQAIDPMHFLAAGSKLKSYLN